MQELVIASNNRGKIDEITSMLPGFSLVSLADIGFTEAIPEPYPTFEENALTKAKTIFEFCGKNVFSDDSGLCVPALQHRPGVHSAYYGGLPRSDQKNNEKLLAALQHSTDRAAFYKCVIALIFEENTYFFEGICEGRIAEKPMGNKGFGYDPLFIPDGYLETFGMLDSTIKNRLSHRGKAIQKMVDFLKQHKES